MDFSICNFLARVTIYGPVEFPVNCEPQNNTSGELGKYFPFGCMLRLKHSDITNKLNFNKTIMILKVIWIVCKADILLQTVTQIDLYKIEDTAKL